MTDHEVMKRALEALNLPSMKTQQMLQQRDEAITALRERLEQPERQALQAAGTHPAPCARHCEAKAYEIEIRGLKSALRAQLEQPEQEPVAYINPTKNNVSTDPVHRHNKDCQPLYTSPPQRKPLTEEEIEDIWVATDVPILGATYIKLVRQIEKAHGIGETL